MFTIYLSSPHAKQVEAVSDRLFRKFIRFDGITGPLGLVAWLLDVAQGLLFNTIERLPLLCEDLCRTIIFVLKVDHRLSRSLSKSISTSVQFPRPLSVNFSHRSIITATELIITAVQLVMIRSP